MKATEQLLANASCCERRRRLRRACCAPQRDVAVVEKRSAPRRCEPRAGAGVARTALLKAAIAPPCAPGYPSSSDRAAECFCAEQSCGGQGGRQAHGQVSCVRGHCASTRAHGCVPRPSGAGGKARASRHGPHAGRHPHASLAGARRAARGERNAHQQKPSQHVNRVTPARERPSA